MDCWSRLILLSKHAQIPQLYAHFSVLLYLILLRIVLGNLCMMLLELLSAGSKIGAKFYRTIAYIPLMFFHYMLCFNVNQEYGFWNNKAKIGFYWKWRRKTYSNSPKFCRGIFLIWMLNIEVLTFRIPYALKGCAYFIICYNPALW